MTRRGFLRDERSTRDIQGIRSNAGESDQVVGAARLIFENKFLELIRTTERVEFSV